MDQAAQVEAFHAAGEPGGLLAPLYLFNAQAISRITPLGARVLDLGCGSGQFAAHLAQLRPDLYIEGWDLSGAMLARGRQALQQRGLGGRVRLHQRDMLEQDGLDSFQTLYSVFALHHLPGSSDMEQLLRGMYRAAARSNASLWVFDHARPRSSRSIEAFPRLMSPHAGVALQRDSAHSLRAALSFAELRQRVQASWGIRAQSYVGHRWGCWYYQYHTLANCRQALGLELRGVPAEVWSTYQLIQRGFPASWVNPSRRRGWAQALASTGGLR